MGRRPNPQRRVELLDEIVDYITDHGLINLSLRPLAAALGTSTYTLTYQFGTKEELIKAAIAHIEDRQREGLGAIVSDRPALTLPAIWEAMTTPAGMKHSRLMIELVALVAQEPEAFKDDQADAVNDRLNWLSTQIAAAGFSQPDALLAATLLQAVLAGLAMDIQVTNDVERTTAALRFLGESLLIPPAPAADVDLRESVSPQQPVESA